MPRITRKREQAPVPTSETTPRELITVAEAARRCGWRRANTFRERFLATEDDAAGMGLGYDPEGRAVVDAAYVATAVAKVEAERASRHPDWRIKNLGKHARKRPIERPKRTNRLRESLTSS